MFNQKKDIKYKINNKMFNEMLFLFCLINLIKHDETEETSINCIGKEGIIVISTHIKNRYTRYKKKC